ncbi:MAG TPA: hypothetical protein VKU00_11130 [Chthonomonadaceae bacterium]|nr:hypothetical protein [Chthonomonadaceae bacterium]
MSQNSQSGKSARDRFAASPDLSHTPDRVDTPTAQTPPSPPLAGGRFGAQPAMPMPPPSAGAPLHKAPVPQGGAPLSYAPPPAPVSSARPFGPPLSPTSVPSPLPMGAPHTPLLKRVGSWKVPWMVWPVALILGMMVCVPLLLKRGSDDHGGPNSTPAVHNPGEDQSKPREQQAEEQKKQRAAVQMKNALQGMGDAKEWLTNLSMGENGKYSNATSVTEIQRQLDSELSGIISKLRGIDISDCPKDFRDAFLINIQSWEKVQESTQELMDFLKKTTNPTVVAGVALRGVWDYITGNPSHGLDELSAEGREVGDRFKGARREVGDTYRAVEKIAWNYGVQVQGS